MIEPKRLSICLVNIAVLAVTAIEVRGHGNEHGEAKATIGSAKVVISYNRPSLKGRDLMKMIHPGDLWRLGADIPTTIESDSDLDFGGTRVPKGKHILMARYVARMTRSPGGGSARNVVASDMLSSAPTVV